MEQTLGHVTHSRNLQTCIGQQKRIDATWLPIPYEVAGAARLVPVLRTNWSVRASWRARRALDRALGRAAHDALFFHSQVTSLFSVDIMRRYPSIVSLDATPINFEKVDRRRVQRDDARITAHDVDRKKAGDLGVEEERVMCSSAQSPIQRAPRAPAGAHRPVRA